MRGLVTDRTQSNISRRASLASKGWSGMTTAERAEWLGDPFQAVGVNLIPPGPYYSSVVNLTYTNSAIEATASAPGTYLYAVSILGAASNFVNKTLTLSVGGITSVGGGIPQLAVYWHSDSGFEYAGASLYGAGSITFNTAEWQNTNHREYLALYVYVTTSAVVEVGAMSRFTEVMLENGETKNEYVPYVEILPTEATKGAYNYSDLNRVERAVEEISALAGLGLTTKTNWSMWDVPTMSEMSRYLGNIKSVRAYCGSTIELPESMNHLTYETANNIEKILLVAYDKVMRG